MKKIEKIEKMKELGFTSIDHEFLKETGKEYKIYAELIDEGTLTQFRNVLNENYITYAALMPDTHSGYTMPIGGVCAAKDHIVPQFVGFDIGCGMCAYKTNFKKEEIQKNADEIYNLIIKKIPLGFTVHKEKKVFEIDLPRTDIAETALNEVGLNQIGTLGGGNHFIEIGFDENNDVWIVIHSGSRGLGHKIASYYMFKAYNNSIRKEDPIAKGLKEFEEDFKIKKAEVLKHNPKGFKLSLEKALKKQKGKLEKKFSKTDVDKIEGIQSFRTDSKDGLDYIKDLNFALEYALENRKRMILKVNESINEATGENHIVDYNDQKRFINRNHNHAEFNKERGEWIHRKGATHAEKGMRGVIPGNMRDGSFVVIGKGNPESLYSSSHGAGRVMSRTKAKSLVKLEDFQESMKGICGTVDINTVDESPFAYKDIFEVMELQKNLVDIEYHIKPLINVKDNTKQRY
jgi:tRNA-splicing ligase RtcB